MIKDINVLDTIVELLKDNYKVENVDGISPMISKIYEVPATKEPQPGKDFILIYSELTSHASVGMGSNNTSDIIETVKIDIRSRPANTTQNAKVNDIHARKCLTEVKRVLYSNITDPDSNFNIIDPRIEQTDLSNGSRGLFRYILKINVIDYCRDMTA